MTKKQALKRMRCETQTELAQALGVTRSAVSHWPDPLPDYAIRRVKAALHDRSGNNVQHR